MFKPKVFRIPDLVQVAGQVARAQNNWKPDGTFVDSTGGFGASVVSNLQNWGRDAVGVHFAEKALDRQYGNKRAEMAFAFAHWIKTEGQLPNCPELVEEATAIEYYFKGDQVMLIEKDQIKEKIGRSTDYWDAAKLTFAYPVQRKHPSVEEQIARHGEKQDYDPIKRHYGGQPVNPASWNHPNPGENDYNPIK